MLLRYAASPANVAILNSTETVKEEAGSLLLNEILADIDQQAAQSYAVVLELISHTLTETNTADGAIMARWRA